MTWFEAYMLWSIGNIGIVFLVSGFAGLAWFVVCILMRASQLDFADIYADSAYKEGKEKYARHMVKADMWTGFIKKSLKFLPVIVIVLTIGFLIPSTNTLLKIIATKKGVDAIQSDTAAKYLGEVDKTITNGLKVLNQEIEKKLDKKVTK